MIRVDAGLSGAGGQEELADGRDALLDVPQVPHLFLQLLEDGHARRHSRLAGPGLKS